MDELQKLKIYNHYCIIQLALIHNFEILDTKKDNWKHGWGNPDKQEFGLAFYNLWKNDKIMTFEEFKIVDGSYNINVDTWGRKFNLIKK